MNNNISLKISIIIIVILIMNIAGVSFTQEAAAGVTGTKVYVSTNGNDTSGDGTSGNPFATADRARRYVRTLNKTAPVEVIFGAGEYNTSNIIISSLDSGAEGAPVTYKAADGQRVVFSGAVKLDTTKFRSITDEQIVEKIDSGVLNKLVEIDLSEQNIPHTIVDYLANHKVGLRGKTMGVFLNDKPQTIAKWPNVGYQTIAEASELNFKITGLTARRLKRWQSANDFYIDGYLRVNWHKEWSRISAVNTETMMLTLENNGLYGIAEGGRIAVVNLPEELDMPGEWYADADTMKMYYYPPHELTADDVFEIATAENNFITLSGARYVNIEGIEFAKNADSPRYEAVSENGGNGIGIIGSSSYVSIKNCTVRDVGMDGIYITNCNNISIDGCDIYNTGFNGISVTGSTLATTQSDNIKISNCRISSVNRDTGNNGMAGVRIVGGFGAVVEHNIFHNIPNSAVRYDGYSNIIRLNEIYNCVNDTQDAGAIYAGRSWASYGTSIKNNYFHSLGPDFDASYQASAVFWDDMHSGNSFIGNIVDMRKTRNTSAVKIGGGRDNIVDGNVFVNSQYGVFGEDRTIDFPSEYNEQDSGNFYNSTAFKTFIRAANNVTNAYYITDTDWKSPFIEAYPAIRTNYNNLVNDKAYYRADTIVGNICYNCTSDGIYTQSNMANDSVIVNNYNAQSADIFVGENDFRVTSAAKQTFDFSDNVMSDVFNISDIGIQGVYSPNDNLKSFKLIYPANNGSSDGSSVTLKWESAPFADEYKYQLATDSDFINIVKEGTTAYNVVQINELTEKEYYWRVIGVNKSRQIGEEFLCDGVYKFTTATEQSFFFDSADSFVSGAWGDFVYNSANQNIIYENPNATVHATQIFTGLGRFSDFEIEFTLDCLKNSGFVFRRNGGIDSGTDGYCLFFTDDSVNLRYLDYEGKLYGSNLASSGVLSASPYKKPVKIKALGSSIKVSVKDGGDWKLVIDTTDTRFSVGYFGYKTYNANDVATLDNIRIFSFLLRSAISLEDKFAISYTRSMGNLTGLTNQTAGEWMFSQLGTAKNFVFETDFISTDIAYDGIRFRDDNNGNFYLLQFYGETIRFLRFDNNAATVLKTNKTVKSEKNKKYRFVITAAGTNLCAYMAEYDDSGVLGELCEILSVSDSVYNRAGYFGSRIQSTIGVASFLSIKLTEYKDYGVCFMQAGNEVITAVRGGVTVKFGVTNTEAVADYAFVSAVYDSDNRLIGCNYEVKNTPTGIQKAAHTVNIAKGQQIRAYILRVKANGVQMLQPVISRQILSCR